MSDLVIGVIGGLFVGLGVGVSLGHWYETHYGRASEFNVPVSEFHACENPGHNRIVRGTVPVRWSIRVIGEPEADASEVERQRYEKAMEEARRGMVSWYCAKDAPLFVPQRQIFFGEAARHPAQFIGAAPER